MGIRWTIGAKLWALALTAAVLIVGVGLTGLQAVGTLQAALTEVRTSGQALRSHMQGDMMHDALRSDVLAALLAAQKGQIDRREAIGTDIEEHAKIFRDAINAEKQLITDPAALREIQALLPVLGDYILSAEKIQSLAFQDLAAAEKVLAAVRPFIRNFNSSKYIEDLANGESCLALGWSCDVLQAQTRATEAGKGVEVNYNIPKEGAVMFFDQLAIPADAKNVDNAYAFINFLLRPEVAAKNSNYISFANSNKASTPMIDKAVLDNPNVYPPAEMMATLVPDMPESDDFQRQLTRVWTRVKTGQ